MKKLILLALIIISSNTYAVNAFDGSSDVLNGLARKFLVNHSKVYNDAVLECIKTNNGGTPSNSYCTAMNVIGTIGSLYLNSHSITESLNSSGFFAKDVKITSVGEVDMYYTNKAYTVQAMYNCDAKKNCVLGSFDVTRNY